MQIATETKNFIIAKNINQSNEYCEMKNMFIISDIKISILVNDDRNI